MKFVLAICFVSVALALEAPYIESWDEFLIKYEKTYIFNDDEMAVRKSIYEENVKEMHEHNAENSTWVAGVNAYSDLSWAEFKQYYKIAPQKCSATGQKSLPATETAIPDAVSWVSKGMVTKVKNQGSCGSCWTFSTIGGLESAWAIAGNKLGMLAEQQLVDCAGGFDNHGCNGGLPSQAFQYLMWAGGSEAESTYKYTGKDGRCAFDKDKVVVTLKSQFNITEGDETDTGLPGAVVKGPVSICYQVVSDFRNYKSGVYTSKNCKNGAMDVNHAVLATGYGTENGTPYYMVKNSWGTSFGMSGYFKIIRGKNMCGIATCSSYPIIN